LRALIDTNLFVYGTYRQFREYEKARNFLQTCQQGEDRWYLAWGVIYEYLSVVTQPEIFKPDGLSFTQALDNVRRFCRSPFVEILQEGEDHMQTLEALSDEYPSLRGGIHHDAHLVTLMREHEISAIYSTDTDFHRFKGIRVINPIEG